MARTKKNQHIIYQRKWHPKSYSEQAREKVKIRIECWETGNYAGGYASGVDFSEVIASACNSNRCDMVKHRMIKGLRRYGKRKGLI
jgi:hypothetical protein